MIYEMNGDNLDVLFPFVQEKVKASVDYRAVAASGSNQAEPVAEGDLEDDSPY